MLKTEPKGQRIVVEKSLVIASRDIINNGIINQNKKKIKIIIMPLNYFNYSVFFIITYIILTLNRISLNNSISNNLNQK